MAIPPDEATDNIQASLDAMSEAEAQKLAHDIHRLSELIAVAHYKELEEDGLEELFQELLSPVYSPYCPGGASPNPINSSAISGNSTLLGNCSYANSSPYLRTGNGGRPCIHYVPERRVTFSATLLLGGCDNRGTKTLLVQALPRS